MRAKDMAKLKGVACGVLAMGLALGAQAGTVAKNVATKEEYATIQAAFDEAADGQTIQLIADVTENVSIKENKAITLDLAGHVLSGDGSASVITINSSSSAVTIRDTSEERAGAITTGGAIYSGGGAGIQVARGSLSLYGVTITNCVAIYGGAIYGGATAQILVKDCVIKNNSANFGGAICMLGGSDSPVGKLALISTVITGNRAEEYGAGVYFKPTEYYGCFVAGTRVAMADGTTKAIEEIGESDIVKTFDHEGGTNSSARVYLVYKGETKAVPFTLEFDDGGKLSIVDRHDLLLKDTRKYVTITESNVGQYIGAKFYGEDGAWHALTNVTMGTEAVEYYSIYSAQHQNVYANGLLTVADDVDYLLNIYELDENLKADAAQLAADLEKYGTFTRERATTYGVNSEEWYADSGIKYLNVAMGKGLISLAYLESLFESLQSSNSSLPTPKLTTVTPKLAGTSNGEPTLTDFDEGVLTLGADVIVTNNTLTSGSASNIYLLDNGTLESLIVLDDSHDGICAGVTLEKGVGQFTTNISVTVTSSDKQYFMSDVPWTSVRYDAECKYLEIVPGIQVGEDAWAYVDDGTCTITGTGDMWDADEWTDGNPLAAYRTSITNVTVNSGVTSIGSQFFHKFYGLNSVSCAESVTNVGDHAFLRCNSLETMNFATTPTFGCDAFKIQAAIRMNGDVPEVYSIPAISVGENAKRVMGKKDLADEEWTDVTNMTADEKRLYHFFKIVVQ